MKINFDYPYVNLVEEHGGIRAAAKSIGMPYSSFHGRYVKALALEYGAKSVTLRHDKDSNEMRPYYLKTNESKVDVVETLRDFDFSSVVPLKVTSLKAVTSDKSLVIPICDLHIGNQCYAAQNNDSDWNLSIVKEEFPRMVAELINDETYDEIVIAINGDFMHFDSAVRCETPVSGHQLQSSGYFGEIVQTSLSLAVGAIEIAAACANRVTVSIISGNHDEASGYWIREYCKAMFRNHDGVVFLEPKVHITHYTYGNSSVLFFHGDKLKFKDAPNKLPAIYPMSGVSKYRYGVSGHFHHLEVKEDNGFTNVMVNSLCPNDDYSSKGCYISRRCLTGLIYDKTAGMVGFKFAVPG